MKLTKNITGCTGGAIYPTTFKKGEDCPGDLVDAAIALGALPDEKNAPAKKKAEDE